MVFAQLLRDPLFLIAFLAFLGSVGVFVWCARHLSRLPRENRRRAPPPSLEGVLAVLPDPTPTPVAPRETAPPPPPPPAPAPPAAASEPFDTAVYRLLEEKFADLSRRIGALEASSKPSKAAPPPDLSPVLKKLQEMDDEINKIKLFVTDMPAPAAAGGRDIAALNERVDGIVKVLESLAAEPEGRTP